MSFAQQVLAEARIGSSPDLHATSSDLDDAGPPQRFCLRAVGPISAFGAGIRSGAGGNSLCLAFGLLRRLGPFH